MLKLSVFMSPTGAHVGGWRLPEAITDAGFNFDRWPDLMKLLERGKFDMMFLADGNGVNGISDPDLLARNPTLRPVVFEPITFLAALATHTSRIGLVATGTTTFEEPFSIARRFAAVDQISKGRAGWNVVTTSNPDDALNFSRTEHVEHSDRFARAEEFLDVTDGLWSSWDEDAFVQDKENGIFLDSSKVHMLNHEGEHFQVRGPLNAAHTPQGRPVIVVAGGSPEARNLAARTADVLFTLTETKEAALDLYKDVKERVAGYGRAPEALKVMPGASIFVGETADEAEEVYRKLQELIPDTVGVATLSRIMAQDLSMHDPCDPMPEITTETKGMTFFRDKVSAMAKKEGLSIRETYRRVLPARGHVLMKGSAADVADQIEDWYRSGACDGFNLVASHLPGGLEKIVQHLVPELQRRGLFREEYEGTTLREHLETPYAAFPARRSDVDQ
ncbi:LLM class flavin-dependent oxidoreductase [Parvularcula marina]|nr:LLM class flavin-dependent oxidoreductase [Parvularcula marina]